MARESLPEEPMTHAESKPNPHPAPVASPESATRAVPTAIATDLLEKLIADRDARAVDRAVTAAKRH
jgi:hypothetical protein